MASKKLAHFRTPYNFIKYWPSYQVSNFFTVRIRRKFVIILSLKIQPHLNCVATLPWAISVS